MSLQWRLHLLGRPTQTKPLPRRKDITKSSFPVIIEAMYLPCNVTWMPATPVE